MERSLRGRTQAGLIIIFAAIIALSPSNFARADTPDDYGAIAYSHSAGVAAVGWGSSDDKALQNAAQQCQAQGGDADCAAFLWFQYGYGALARSSSGEFGTGWGSNGADADKYAIQTCKNQGATSCNVILRASSPGVAADSSAARGGDGSRQVDQPDRPLVTREDIFLALKCGVDVAKKNIPDEDLRRSVDAVDLGRDLAATQKSVEHILFTLGISLLPMGCIEPLVNPQKAGG